MIRPLTAALCAVLFAGCASTASNDPPPQSSGAQPGGDAYASTYRAIASAPVLISGATVLTGDGRRPDNADVLLQDGPAAQVGSRLSAAADAIRVDGSGK